MQISLFGSLNYLGRTAGAVSRRFHSLARRFESQGAHQAAVIQSTKYNMRTEADEVYYAQQYWLALQTVINQLPDHALILDVGCGQGRFTEKFARAFPNGTIRGCDISPEAIRDAQEHLAKIGAVNARVEVADARTFLIGTNKQSADAILMLEVSIFLPEWKSVLSEAVQVLRPGGFLVASFRPTLFNACHVTQQRHFEALELVISRNEGSLFAGSPVTFTWQSSYEIREFFTETLGLTNIQVIGIGTLSGIPGDPHSSVCRPSEISQEHQQSLMNAELTLGTDFPDSGRYILATAQKSK